jgi:hypothetical protein
MVKAQGCGAKLRRRRRPSAGEGDEEGITLRVDLDALVLGEHGAESPPVLVQRLAVDVAELLQQPRRTMTVQRARHRAAPGGSWRR